jgi:hypothetical protein
MWVETQETLDLLKEALPPAGEAKCCRQRESVPVWVMLMLKEFIQSSLGRLRPQCVLQ